MLNATHGTGAYTEKVTGYDKNGNITGLQRYNSSLVDNLTYTYNGNQLTKVEDATGNSNGFANGASTSNEYTYDANGNLTKDSNKGIASITYNSLNLPQVVTFSNGNTITYLYAADGRKLRTVHVVNGTTTTTDYSGNVIYESGIQKLLLTEEGYVNLANSNTYYYYLKDHQGNNRVVVSSSGTVAETNHYYPFGGTFATSSSSVQPYKYNGKELDTKAGLNWYDYGARHYDAALGRWHVVDPLVEKYYSTSPYGYCFNNPIKHIDVDGKFPFETIWDAFNLTLGLQSLKSNLKSGNYWDATVDGLGLALDAAATVLPYVPGGVSSAIKAARGADDLVDVANITNKVDNAKDAIYIINNKDKVRFVGDVDGKVIDTATTPKGTYIQPNGAETDVLGREHINKVGGGKTESVGTSHTQKKKKNIAPNGKVYLFREDNAHIPTYEEIMNIINGNATKK